MIKIIEKFNKTEITEVLKTGHRQISKYFDEMSRCKTAACT